MLAIALVAAPVARPTLAPAELAVRLHNNVMQGYRPPVEMAVASVEVGSNGATFGQTTASSPFKSRATP